MNDSKTEASKIVAWNLRWLADEVEAGRAVATLSIKREREVVDRPHHWDDAEAIANPQKDVVDHGCIITVEAQASTPPPPVTIAPEGG